MLACCCICLIRCQACCFAILQKKKKLGKTCCHFSSYVGTVELFFKHVQVQAWTVYAACTSFLNLNRGQPIAFHSSTETVWMPEHDRVRGHPERTARVIYHLQSGFHMQSQPVALLLFGAFRAGLFLTWECFASPAQSQVCSHSGWCQCGAGARSAGKVLRERGAWVCNLEKQETAVRVV